MIPSASNSEKENGFMTNNMRTRDIRRMILIGLIVALVSQLYWNIFINNFRISSSVIILPVLLMTLGKSLSTPLTCAVTAVIVFFFRLFPALHSGTSLLVSAKSEFTNAIYLLCSVKKNAAKDQG